MSKNIFFYKSKIAISSSFFITLSLLIGCEKYQYTQSPIKIQPQKEVLYNGKVGTACNKESDCSGILVCKTKWITSAATVNKEVKVCVALEDADKSPVIINSHLTKKGIEEECQHSGFNTGSTDYDNCILELMNIIGDNK